MSLDKIGIFLVILACFGLNSAAPPLIAEVPEFEKFQEIIPLERLPQTVIPTHYNVELQPILDDGFGPRFTAPGKVWIDVTCQNATNRITLHALTLSIMESSVKVLKGY